MLLYCITMLLYCIAVILYYSAAGLTAGAVTAGFSLHVSGNFPPLAHLAPPAVFAVLGAGLATDGCTNAIICSFIGVPLSIAFLYSTDSPDVIRIYGPAMLFAFIIGYGFAGFRKELDLLEPPERGPRKAYGIGKPPSSR